MDNLSKNRDADQALQESEEKYRYLFNSAQDLIHIVDADGRIIDANDTELTVLGYTRQEYIGKRLTDIIHPDCLENTKNAFARIMQGKAIHAYETAFITSDGNKVYVEASAAPRMEAGEVTSSTAICRDITRRKQAENALRESEMRFTTIVQTAPDAILSIDENQCIILFNKGAEDAFGYQSDEVLGKPLNILIPEQFRNIHKESVADFAIGNEIARYMGSRDDITCINKEGKEFLAEASISKSETSGKKVMSVILRDISERRQMENALNASESKYRQLVNMSPDAIVVHRNGKILYTNPSAIQLLEGKNAKDLLGKPLLDIVHPDFHEKVLARIQNLTINQMPAPLIEEKLLKLTGEEFDAEVIGTMIDYEGEPAVMTLVRDISFRKQSARALAESESKFRSLAESTTVAIFLFREHFLYTNPKCSEMSGYSQEQLLQMGLADLLHPDSLSEVQQNWEKRKQGDTMPKPCDVQFLTKTGETRWGQLTTAMINFENTPTSVGSVVDITDRIQIEEQLREQRGAMQAILDYAPAGIWRLDINKRIKFINSTFCSAVGVDEQRFLEAEHYSRLLPEDVSRGCVASDKACFDTMTQVSSIEDIPCVDGKVHNFEIVKAPIFNEQGIMQGLVGMATDITERKLIEENLREINARITSLVDNLQGGVLFEDQHSHMAYLNQTFCDMFSIPAPPEAIMGTDCAQAAEEAKHMFTDPEGFLAGLKTAEDKQRLIIGQEIAMADGRTFEYDYIPILIDKKLCGHLWHYRDITGFKQKETSIQRLSNENSRLAQQLLHAQERERQTLARELHDELGQSLTMIKTELGRAASRSWNRKDLTKIIQAIDETTDHVIATTRDMLQRLHPHMIDSAGLRDVLTRLAEKWEKQQGVSCAFDSSGDLDDLNDSIQLVLYRIAQESLTNIVRHAHARQVHLSCYRHKPSENGSAPRDTVTLIISDDGTGIKESDAPQHGLGLIGIRERTQSVGGELKIKSAPNKGTRIAVTIPLEKGDSS